MDSSLYCRAFLCPAAKSQAATGAGLIRLDRIGYRVRMRLSTVLPMICVLTGIAHAQTASELEATFGKPDRNVYKIAPNVRLTVTYADDLSACSLKLQSTKWISGAVRQPGTFDADIADHVLDEIAAPSVRKGTPRVLEERMGCAAVRWEEYDNVSISRVTTECLPISRHNVQSLTITWKRLACK